MRDTETGAIGVIVDVSISAGVRTILCESGEIRRKPSKFRLATGAGAPAALVAKAKAWRKPETYKAPRPSPPLST